MKKSYFKSCVLFIFILLSGCSVVNENKNSSVSLYPLEYQLSITPNEGGVRWQIIDDFLLKHKKLLLTQPISIYYADKSKVKKTVLEIKSKLKKIGVSEELIYLYGISEWDSEITLSFIHYIPIVDSCINPSIYEVDRINDGCFVTKNRWLSMTNPERMLPNLGLEK